MIELPLSVELEVLNSSVHAELFGVENSNKVKNLASLDLSRLLNLACHHGVIRQVFAYCQFHALLNDKDYAVFRQATLFMAINATSLEQQLLKVVSVFEESNVTYALMKGPAIQQLFGDPKSKECFRNSADIDLLVNVQDLHQIVDLLESVGYIAEGESPLTVAKFAAKHTGLMKFRDMGFHSKSQSVVNIDLHWRVTHEFSLPITTGDALDRSVDIFINKQSVKTLSFNDHFLLICIHGYLDQFFILKYLVDVYWAVNHKDFNLNEILVHAKKYGVEQQVKDTISTVNDFFKLEGAVGNVGNLGDYSRAYSKLVKKRYITAEDMPNRMYSVDKPWTVRDKISYIIYQVKTRSKNVPFFKPLLHHFKYDSMMIVKKPRGISGLLWLPFAWLTKRF